MAQLEAQVPIYFYHKGTNYKSYEFLAPQRLVKDNVEGWIFRVWAPHAKSVSVVGNFNNWDRTVNEMNKISDEIWEVFIPELKVYDIYKYSIEAQSGEILLKADPYALHTETAPANASKLYESTYKWGDKTWLKNRETFDSIHSPINIYEVHLGSWVRHEDGHVCNYRDIADKLVTYLLEMNYTHVEILPITEYPYDGSWGYQVTGMFAPTSRYGTPDDFKYLIDKLHKNGIGVILDWVVAHFPKDAHGLYQFDGAPLYEYTNPKKAEHKEWGTMVFDYGRPEVVSYLISSANFWVEQYHIDGIRVDAVASMLYLDYARKDGEWEANKYGGKENLEAIAFLQNLNTSILTEHKGVMMIAEESTAFPLVTKPAYEGGLGFNFKWNMGWMNDMLRYVSANPFFRKDMHNNITFAITYAYSENYILPLSHDEVVHGKCSLLSKMPGEYEEKFEGLKAFLGFMMAHPGKKLLFMGGEFGQFIEWDYKKQLDWFLLDYPPHSNMRKFVKELNAYYLKHPEMYEQDDTYNGFNWLVVDDNQQNIVSFVRYDKEGNHTVAVVNFSPVPRNQYKMGVPENATYKVTLSSRSKALGGDLTISNLKYKATKLAAGDKMHGQDQYIEMSIPANSVTYLKPIVKRKTTK